MKKHLVVALAYVSLSLLGWQVMCRAFSSPGSDVSTETLARAVAVRDTGFGGVLLTTDTTYFSVFYESPGDFGGDI